MPTEPAPTEPAVVNDTTGDPAPDRYPDDAARWAAVLARDPAADGRFVYAVASTGIYCRPSCPARRPARANARFFDDPDDAEAAGYRACRRCRPGEPDARRRMVARVVHLLATLEPEPTLAELAAEVGVNRSHLQRGFAAATGVSPARYAAALRETRLAAGLRRGEVVARAVHDAGYGSERALYGAPTKRLGMDPSAYRSGGAGERIGYARFGSPLGRALIAATGEGVVALRFAASDADDPDAALVAELRAEFPAAELTEDPAGLAEAVARTLAYLDGEAGELELPLAPRGTAFQRAVWRALGEIPPGETRSYGELAAMMGRPSAARAVARALATNPVALAVPCHRVVRAGGALSGYRWGVERKRALLALERGDRA